MYDDYQLRKDINRVITFLNNLEKIEDDDSILALLKEELGKYYDSSEVDVISDKLNNDLEVLDDSLTDLTSSLVEFNDELISFDKDNNNLKTDLSKLKDNLHRFTSAVDGLNTDLSALDSSLTQLSSDVDGYADSIDDLLTAVGDNNSGLVKSMNTLSATVGDANSGLVKQANDTSSSVTKLGNDLTTLNGSLNTLSGTVGNNSSGLVKQVNDLSSSVDNLDSDLDTLDGNLTSLTGIVGSNSSGLVKDLNDLTSTVNSLDDDIFGTNGLASRLTATENSLGTANSDLGKLVYSLNTLSDYLTTFEGTLDEFEDELESNPNIDVSELNANIVALFGVIGSVKNDVTTVESDITQAQTDINSTNSSINNVKTDLYGSKTVNGQTVPKDPTDTPSNDSLKKNLQTVKTTVGDSSSGLVKGLNDASSSIGNVKTDLYGSNGSASSPAAGSVKANVTAVKNTVGDSTSGLVKELNDAQTNISTVQDDIYGDGQNKQGVLADLSDLTGTITDEGGLIDQLGDVGENVDSVKGEIYGTKTITVDGQQVTVPKDSTDTPSSDSVIGKANAIKTDLYGAKTVNGQTVPKEKTDTPDANSVKGLINKVDDDINNQTTGLNVKVTGLEGNIDTVSDGLDTANGHIGTIQTQMYGGSDYSMSNPADGSLKKKIDTAEGNITTVQGDITDLDTIVGTTTSKVQTDGSLQTQITYLPAYIDRLFVTKSSNIYSENVNYSKLNVGEVGYIILAITELAKKIIRDNGSVTYTVYVTDPDNITTTLTRTQNYTYSSRQSISFTFSKVGLYVVACEHLKYVVWVGEEIPHTHTTSDITGLGTWETVSTSVTGVALYVNQALRLVSFHFYASITFASSGYTTCGTLPSAYKPLSQVTLPFRQSEQHGYISDDGVIYIAGTGTKNAGTSAMWCY